MKRPAQATAFTLTELLVVIAIIAILTAVVLPSIGSSIEKARSIDDLNRLKQISVGVRQFAEENGDTMFPATSTPDSAWPALLHQKYVPAWAAFKSPFDHRPDVNASPYPVSYGINDRIFTDNIHPAPASPAHYAGSPSEFISPSELILMAPALDSTSEIRFSGVSTANVSIQAPPASPKLGTMSMRSRINVIYADGHGATLLWRDYSDSTSNPAGLRRWFPLGF